MKKLLKQLESKIKSMHQGISPLEAESTQFSSDDVSQIHSYLNVLGEKLKIGQSFLKSPSMIQEVNDLFKSSASTFFNQSKAVDEENSQKMELRI